MKKPNINIDRAGPTSDVLEMKIGDNITIYCKKWAEAQLIEEMIDALIDIRQQIKGMKNTDFVAAISTAEVSKALKKAGCTE